MDNQMKTLLKLNFPHMLSYDLVTLLTINNLQERLASRLLADDPPIIVLKNYGECKSWG
jgi:hypothetical protein